MINMEEHYIDTGEQQKLWIGRMGNPTGTAILMIHGAIENSRIFYSEKGKGLAPFLAEKGFDVFVADLRGKGKSTPAASSRRSKGGQYEVIMHDIPAMVDHIKKLKGEDTRIHLAAHSWGGVLVAAWYARFAHTHPGVRSLVYFACKRKIYVHHIRRWFMVDLMWTSVGSIVTRLAGYLPAKKLRMGADDEPAQFFFECNCWVYSNSWIDPRDGFNYHKAFQQIHFPPVFSMTGANDHSLGNTICVKKMLHEIGGEHTTHQLLGKRNGNLHDYDHINILTHPDAPKDHFMQVLNWLNEHN